MANKELNSDEATGLLKVVTDYAYALDILDTFGGLDLYPSEEENRQICFPDIINEITIVRFDKPHSFVFE